MSLLYADDVVLMAQNAEGLQKMINALREWPIKWRLSLIVQKKKKKKKKKKTQVMHIQKHQTRRKDYAFHFVNDLHRIADSYRYLGLDINEFVNFSNRASVFHDAGSRAVDALVLKHYTSKELDYKVFEKIYNSTVVPVMDYAVGVWRYKAFDSHERLHHKAVRTFLGVGKQYTIIALV